MSFRFPYDRFEMNLVGYNWWKPRKKRVPAIGCEDSPKVFFRHRFLLLLFFVDSDVVGVEDRVVHLVAYQCAFVERTAYCPRHGGGGARTGPSTADLFVAATAFGSA